MVSEGYITKGSFDRNRYRSINLLWLKKWLKANKDNKIPLFVGDDEPIKKRVFYREDGVLKEITGLFDTIAPDNRQLKDVLDEIGYEIRGIERTPDTKQIFIEVYKNE